MTKPSEEYILPYKERICKEDIEWFDEMMNGTVSGHDNEIKQHIGEGQPKYLKVLLGAQASGKGFLTQNFHLLDKHTITCNYDQIIDHRKERIAEQEEFKRKDRSERQKRYYEHKSAIRDDDGACKISSLKDIKSSLNALDESIEDIAITKRFNLLWESTGLSIDWMFEAFKIFEREGYIIQVHIPIPNFTLLADMIVKREKDTGQSGEIDNLDDKIMNILYNLVKLYKKVDELIIYDNYTDEISKNAEMSIALTIRKDENDYIFSCNIDNKSKYCRLFRQFSNRLNEYILQQLEYLKLLEQKQALELSNLMKTTEKVKNTSENNNDIKNQIDNFLHLLQTTDCVDTSHQCDFSNT